MCIKVTIIWALQSGTRVVQCERHIREPSGSNFGVYIERAVSSPAGRQRFFSYIHYTDEIRLQQVSIGIRAVT